MPLGRRGSSKPLQTSKYWWSSSSGSFTNVSDSTWSKPESGPCLWSLLFLQCSPAPSSQRHKNECCSPMSRWFSWSLLASETPGQAPKTTAIAQLVAQPGTTRVLASLHLTAANYIPSLILRLEFSFKNVQWALSRHGSDIHRSNQPGSVNLGAHDPRLVESVDWKHEYRTADMEGQLGDLRILRLDVRHQSWYSPPTSRPS